MVSISNFAALSPCRSLRVSRPAHEFVDVIAESVFEQWDNDIEVWNTKRYLPKPLVNRSESLIPVYRRWYEQFYRPVRDVDEPRQDLVETA